MWNWSTDDPVQVRAGRWKIPEVSQKNKAKIDGLLDVFDILKGCA